MIARRGLRIVFAAAVACIGCGSNPIPAADFQGAWRSTSSTHTRTSESNATTLNLRQFGLVVCGEWAESVGTGKVLGGNITGRVKGHQMRANVGEDIYWARTGRFPHQDFESVLFVLQGRQLIWYARNKLSRLDKIQTFERVSANKPSARSDFMDRQFARLCPAGGDFVSARR
jgi:hypothetical protein